MRMSSYLKQNAFIGVGYIVSRSVAYNISDIFHILCYKAGLGKFQ